MNVFLQYNKHQNHKFEKKIWNFYVSKSGFTVSFPKFYGRHRNFVYVFKAIAQILSVFCFLTSKKFRFKVIIFHF